MSLAINAIAPLPCPICGKQPKVIAFLDFNTVGFGASCVVQCKPFLRKAHLKAECNNVSNEWAEQTAIYEWNQLVNKTLTDN